MHAFHRTTFLILLALAGLTAGRLPAQTPQALVAGFQIDSVMVTQGYPNRLAYEAVSGRLYYCLPGGDIYAISLPAGQPATEARIATLADHGIQQPQGLHVRDSVLYVSGFTEGPSRTVVAHISKGTLQPNGTRPWATIASTQSHPYSKHPFTSVISDPAGEYLYWASGARTMAGEVWSDNGTHPGRRESPYNGRLFRIPIDTLGMVLPADSATLDNSGFVYCAGLRNAFDMDWDAAGNLFAIDNSGERDDPEELNWLRPGHHYGFPWRMGDHWNPLLDPAYDVNQDPLVNHQSGGYQNGIFTADPAFPAPPSTVLDDPLRNYGPDAVYYRDSITGQVHQVASGDWLRTFTSHRSPLGFFIDRDSLLMGGYAGRAFALSYMPGGDSSGMSPVAPWGTPGPFVDPCQDLLELGLHWDAGLGEYVLASRRILAGFYLPVDAAQVGNQLYVLEQRGGGRHNLWRVTFPTTGTAVQAPVAAAYQLSLSPNPSAGRIEVRLEVGRAEVVQLSVQDLAGRTVLQARDWQLRVGGNRLSLQLDGLAAGSYVLAVEGAQGRTTRRIVRQ